jgi:hypothetical protein
VSERDGRRLTVCLLPGDPHALLLEETVASFRPDAVARLGLTARETEVLRAAAVIEGEAAAKPRRRRRRGGGSGAGTPAGATAD